MDEEDLVRSMRRGGLESLVAAEEILLREAYGEKGAYLKEILEISRIASTRKVEAGRLKDKAAEIIVEKGFLAERNFLAILNNSTSQDIKRRATIKYRSLTEKIPNYVLEQIIRLVVSEKEWAANLLLEQADDTDDLLVIEEELTGDLQRRAWKKHRELGINIEDGLWLIGFIEPLAYITWQEIKKQTETKNVNEKAKIYYEASKETNSRKIKREALNKLWALRTILDREQKEHIEEYAELITIERPRNVREWIYENFSRLPLLEYEGLKRIISATKVAETKKKMIRKAIEEAKREINSKGNMRWPRDIERIKYLKKEMIRLERELNDLQKETEEPPKKEAPREYK